MMVSERDQVISDETAVNFVNFTKKLKPTETETNEFALSDILDSYKDHQSIIKIRSQKNDE